jgi:hypothetical protein
LIQHAYNFFTPLNLLVISDFDVFLPQEPIYVRNLELLQTKQLLLRKYEELLKEQQARRGGRTLAAVQAATSPQKASPALVM